LELTEILYSTASKNSIIWSECIWVSGGNINTKKCFYYAFLADIDYKRNPTSYKSYPFQIKSTLNVTTPKIHPLLDLSPNTDSNAESLSDILGIDYNATYIPFMLSAGLISRKVHNHWKTTVLTTNIAEWKAFIGQNSLSAEISYMCCDQGSKAYYVSLGCFHHKSFTIKQQLTEPSLVKKISLRLLQQLFSENLASLSFEYHEDIEIPSKKNWILQLIMLAGTDHHQKSIY
jgi:hypothetical protein